MQELNELILEKQQNFNAYKDMIIAHSGVYYDSGVLLSEWQNGKKGRRASISISDNYKGVNISITLAKTDNIEKDVNMFLERCEEIMQGAGLSLSITDEHVSGRWIRHSFSDADSKIFAHIFFNYEESDSCKVVGSGKFEEKMKRVCI